MIQAHVLGDRITSTSEEAFALYERSRFGEKEGDAIIYNSLEALFLAEQKKLVFFRKGKEQLYEQMVSLFKKRDKKLLTKLAVYRDLRKRGYIVKTALKFGAEFRVYEKGVKPGEEHARWILFSAREHESLSWHEFTAKNRIAHATKKKLLIAIVDEEGDVSYYESGWMRL